MGDEFDETLDAGDDDALPDELEDRDEDTNVVRDRDEDDQPDPALKGF